MEEKKFHNSKLLRYGYTTGSCAAAAAKAAAQMLRTGQPVSQVRIVTPSGVPLTLDVLDPVLGEDSASCAIRKDGGDDPDATSVQRVQVTGVSFDDLTLADWEAAKLGTIEAPFTAEDYQVLEQ